MSHNPKNTANAINALFNDLLAKPSIENNGAIITITGKFERIYKLEVGVRSPGSISFIIIIPL